METQRADKPKYNDIMPAHMQRLMNQRFGDMFAKNLANAICLNTNGGLWFGFSTQSFGGNESEYVKAVSWMQKQGLNFYTVAGDEGAKNALVELVGESKFASDLTRTLFYGQINAQNPDYEYMSNATFMHRAFCVRGGEASFPEITFKKEDCGNGYIRNFDIDKLEAILAEDGFAPVKNGNSLTVVFDSHEKMWNFQQCLPAVRMR